MKSKGNKGFGKRGGELTITQLIAIVIGVVILVIVSYTLYNYYVTGVFWWAKNLPEPDRPDGSDGTSMEVVRYSLGEADVKYYTGTEWVRFPKEGNIKFRDKIIYRNELVKEFEDAYFSNRDKKTIHLEKGTAIIESLEKGPSIYEKSGLGKIEELRAYAFVSATNPKTGPDTYIVNYNGNLYKRKPSDDSSVAYVGTVSVVKEETAKSGSMLDITLNLDLKGLAYEKSASSIQKHLSVLNGKKSLIHATSRIDEIAFPGGEYVLKLRAGEIDKPLPVPVLGVNYQAFDVYFKGVRLPITVYFAFKIDIFGITMLLSGFIYVEKPEFSKVYSLVDSPTSDEKTIVQEVEKWRNSILESPMKISYTTEVSGGGQGPYCGKILLMNGQRYILVYLDKPIEVDEFAELDKSTMEEKCVVETIGK